MTDHLKKPLAFKQPETFKPPEHRFFGRRKGPHLSARKQNLIEQLLPNISITLSEFDESLGADQKYRLNEDEVFDQSRRALWLEIGFGKGEHLAWQAKRFSDVGIIGCEPYLNGVAGLLTAVAEQQLDNVRIYGDDARHVIWSLPDQSIERVFLLHPDPWPKTRHARRRFVNPSNLDQIARIMIDGGELRIGTDHPTYREWTCAQMIWREDFTWLAETPDDWLNRPDDWPETRYEAKAIEGFATYFRYRRNSRSSKS